MANSQGWGLLSCQIPQGGDEQRGQMPRPLSINTVTFFIDRTVDRYERMFFKKYQHKFDSTVCVSKAWEWRWGWQMPGKCPTPGTDKAGKCPAVARIRGGGGWVQLEFTDA